MKEMILEYKNIHGKIIKEKYNPNTLRAIPYIGTNPRTSFRVKVKNNKEAKKYGERIIEWYNSTLRPTDTRRTFVNAYIINDKTKNTATKNIVPESKIQELSPEGFLWENYEPCWWDILDANKMRTDPKSDFVKSIKKYAIGYCDGSRLSIRPKETDYGVMFFKDGEQFWFHIPKIMLDAILEQLF